MAHAHPESAAIPRAYRDGRPITLWHIIPVGPPPAHEQSAQCWCYPTLEPAPEPTMIVHRPATGEPWAPPHGGTAP